VGFIDSIKDAIRGDADRKGNGPAPDAVEPVTEVPVAPEQPVGGGAHADRAAAIDDQEGQGTRSGSTGGKHAAPRAEDAASA
jgi:hypothetical protein